eukprot:6202053-Pleurochrysis_carterae.AAC.3
MAVLPDLVLKVCLNYCLVGRYVPGPSQRVGAYQPGASRGEPLCNGVFPCAARPRFSLSSGEQDGLLCGGWAAAGVRLEAPDADRHGLRRAEQPRQ